MKYSNRIISPTATLLEALKQMDKIDRKLLIVLKEEIFIGLLSAGDIQRAIIKNQPLDTLVKLVLRGDIRIAKPEDPVEKVKEMMKTFRMELCPVVNELGNIEKIYLWEDLFMKTELQEVGQFNLPVVIMAGGYGTRLRPLTHVLPKPLIPIGEKTMLEEIFDRFGRHGCEQFYISVNYKADLIEFYLSRLDLPYKVDYFQEVSPMGTAGSLTLLKDKLKERFFVNNCDILIEQDYSEVLDYHIANENEITLVAVMKTFAIPYGTIETGNDGQLIDLKEKPDLTFKINSGMYLLEPHLLSEIPEGEFFHITHLIERINKRNGKVGVFPVNERSWKDIGDWQEYLKLIL